MIHRMQNRVAIAVLLACALPAFAAEPVRTGQGIMTFDTVPGWGLLPSGKSALGPTHGGVVIDKAGNIYTSANKGIVVFDPAGKVIREFVGKDYSNMHDIEIRAEGDAEFIYGARNNNREGIKFNAKTGEVVMRLPYPVEAKLTPPGGKFPMNPTAITVADNGDIFLSNGYATNHIFKFDKNGKYLMHFGKKGNGMEEFNTAHGMTLDTRYDPHRLLICDRNHKPRGRLVHYSLDGKFLGEVVTGLWMPTAVAIQGEYVAIPDLHGMLHILDKTNKVISVVGENPDPKKGRSYGIKQAQWVEGAFAGTHGAYWDADGNLYVQDWNVSGRIMKLVRVKDSASAGAPNTLSDEQKADGWQSLFNGKNLAGWSIKSGIATYKVEDNAIVGTTAKGSPNTFLVSDAKFADFELTFDVLLHDNALNSGVQIRAKLKGDKHGGRVYGPQVEIEAGPGQSGFIYGEAAGGWQSPEPKSKDKAVNSHDHFKNGEWNHYRVRAVGQKIETWINGEKIADLTHDKRWYDENPAGAIGLQVHGVGNRGPFSVRWRNIYVRPIK